MKLEGSCHCRALRFGVEANAAPPANVRMMLGAKPGRVAVEGQAGDAQVERYPDASLADWHAAQGWPAQR